MDRHGEMRGESVYDAACEKIGEVDDVLRVIDTEPHCEHTDELADSP